MLVRLLVLPLLLNLLSLHGQEYLFDVQYLGVEEGLPERKVLDVAQDHDKLIWISTPGHLHRYDSERFTTFPYDLLGIGESAMCYLEVDVHNRIWYCKHTARNEPGYGGILTQDGSVISISEVSNGRVQSEDMVHIARSGNTVLVATKKGEVYAYDGRFELIFKREMIRDEIQRVQACKDEGIWLMYNNYLLKILAGEVQDSFHVDNQGFRVTRVVREEPPLIIESNNNGQLIKKYHFWNGKQFVPYHYGTEPRSYEEFIEFHPDFSCVLHQDTLKILDRNGEVRYRNETVHSASSSFRYLATLTDRDSILWIGSTHGIYKVIRKRNPFKVYQKGQSIRGIYREGNMLYVGSYRENARIDLETGAKSSFLGISPHAACTFARGDEGGLWIGTTKNEVIYYDSKNNLSKVYRLEEVRNANVVFNNPAGREMYLGTDNGLYYWYPDSTEFLPVFLNGDPSTVKVMQIVSDPEGLWIVTTRGLFLLDAGSNTVLEHIHLENGLPHENLLSLHRDGAGIIWIGTKGGGLIRWDRQYNQFRQFDEADGLYNTTIYAVIEDSTHHLWLPSDRGLMQFNKTTQQTKLYLPKNGIPHEEFNTFSYYRDDRGHFYFGGLEGLIQFHPDEFSGDNRRKLPLSVRAVRVLNQNNSELVNITADFHRSNQIVLTPGNRLLEIEANLINYEDPYNQQFAYRIEDSHDHWVYSREGTFTFFNLPYGKYHIHLKGQALTIGKTSEILSIPVWVKRPLYLQWPFILAALALLILTVVLISRWRIRMLKADKERLAYEVAVRTQKIEWDKQVIARQAEELKELDEMKSHFFSNITHEFRTPLTLIMGPVKQLMEHPSLPTVVKRRLSGVMKNADHMLNLITQLLDLSKIEGRQMQIEVIRGDIVAHTRELVNRFQPMARHRQQRLVFFSTVAELPFQFDLSKWEKIVFNLLSNALKFTPREGAIQVSLDSLVREEGAMVRLTVCDSGIGITEEDQKKIFDRFYQTKTSSSRVQGGAGIGLSLVRELVHLQGGHIFVYSVLNKGASFDIRLPELCAKGGEVQFVEAAAHQEVELSGAPIGASQPIPDTLKELDILVVEDNADMREYIKEALQGIDCQIINASNGEEGLRKAQVLIPDVIISDVMMPKMNGFAFTTAIRQHLPTSHIPLILLTARTSQDSRMQGLSRGADDYLTKPFSPAELLIRIRNLVKMRREWQERYRKDTPEEKDPRFQKEDAFIAKVKAYILENIDEPELNGERIGAHFAMSRVHLYRKIKALTDQSISELVRSIRVKKAYELLQTGELNVSEVAYETGFSSYSQLSKVFKKTYGFPPSDLLHTNTHP